MIFFYCFSSNPVIFKTAPIHQGNALIGRQGIFLFYRQRQHHILYKMHKKSTVWDTQ